MYSPLSAESAPSQGRADPAKMQRDLWSCMYITMFAALYTLSFAMPYWGADVPPPSSGDHLTPPPPRSDHLFHASPGAGAYHHHPHMVPAPANGNPHQPQINYSVNLPSPPRGDYVTKGHHHQNTSPGVEIHSAPSADDDHSHVNQARPSGDLRRPHQSPGVNISAPSSKDHHHSHLPSLSGTPGRLSLQGKSSQLQMGESSPGIWRYGWEYTGLGVRILTLLLLLCGSAVSMCRLCLWTARCPSLPPATPVICGIVGGVTGVYSELVLGLGVYLLAPNMALTESQVFCSVTSVFCFLVGVAVHRSTAAIASTTAALGAASLNSNATDAHFESGGEIGVGSGRHFLSQNDEGFDDSFQGKRTSAAISQEAPEQNCAAVVTSHNSNGQICDICQEDELCRAHHEEFASLVSADECPPEHLPAELQTSDESLPEYSARLSDGEEEKDETRPQKDQAHLDGLQDERLAERNEREKNGHDFDHRGQFIDDDFFYHSSDDLLLEQFIEVGSLGSSEMRGLGSHLGSLESCVQDPNDTARLIQAGRTPQLLPFPDSEEYHSFSDDGSCKNKTWP